MNQVMTENKLERPSANESQEEELQNFLKEIFELDQSDTARSKAKECLERLESREADFVGSSLEDAYWNEVSLESLHIGQTEAIMNGDMEKSRKYFLKAKAAAEKGISDAWLAYIDGTLRYLDNDKVGLIETMDRAAENRSVLQKFLDGLNERGAPDYKVDYTK